MKNAGIILIIFGIVYAVAPDVIPGPVDDILVNAVTVCLAMFIDNKKQE